MRKVAIILLGLSCAQAFFMGPNGAAPLGSVTGFSPLPMLRPNDEPKQELPEMLRYQLSDLKMTLQRYMKPRDAAEVAVALRLLLQPLHNRLPILPNEHKLRR